MPILQNSRSETVYLCDYSASKSILHPEFKKYSGVSCEISIAIYETKTIYSDNNLCSSSEIELQELLKFAWSLKFLDFIIIIADNRNEVILEYNPFKKIFNKNDIRVKQTLFPDEQQYINGFVLNTNNRKVHLSEYSSNIYIIFR